MLHQSPIGLHSWLLLLAALTTIRKAFTASGITAFMEKDWKNEQAL
jgi:hypothetical protein